MLAAGTGKDGPGPLVSTLAGKAAATFPIPIVIVPGSLRTRRSTRSRGEAVLARAQSVAHPESVEVVSPSADVT